MTSRACLVFVLTNIFLLGEVVAADGSTDFFQEMGKMYVVVTVVVVMIIGLALYLYRLDRKIAQLEENTSHGKE